MSRLTTCVTRPIDEFVFKEDEEEKHRRHILPMSPRPSTAIPQVPPDSCPPGHGHYSDPEPPLPHPHEARGGGASGGSRVSGRPPQPPGPMLVHAPNLWGWRVDRFGVTGGAGGGVHARDGGVSGGTCRMTVDGRGFVAGSFPRRPS